MRQVPHYLLIGNGCLAYHIQHYFSLLQFSFETWCRAESLTALSQKATAATHILLLIKDDAIEAFARQHCAHHHAYLIHFSGVLTSTMIYGAHPLMTFSRGACYSLERYRSIPFIVDEHAPECNVLLPGLPNPFARLSLKDKVKYHAFCVMASNFSCLLWQKLFAEFEQTLHLPVTLAYPLLKQQTENLMTHAKTALTGPLMRRDMATVAKHLEILSDDPFYEVYQGFLKAFWKK